MKIRNTKYIVGGAFILLGIGIVVATNLPKSFQYYVTVDELLLQENKYTNVPVKVAGKVEKGSIHSDQQLHRFGVVNAGKLISVEYRGPLPDTFKEGADVVVTGIYRGGEFAATDVLAKCASRYEDRLKPGYGTPTKSGM